MPFEQSTDLFKYHWLIWKSFGIIPSEKFRYPYLLWSILFNVVLTLFYPIHLIIGFFQSQTKDDIFKNLSIDFTGVSTSVKFALICYYLKDIRRINIIFAILDNRSKAIDEKIYLKDTLKNGKIILISFGIALTMALLSALLSNIIDNQRDLLYPAWFPMDWKESNAKFLIAYLYQLIGLALQIICDFASDTFSSLCLLLLRGHVRLLALRVSKLGMDSSKSYNKKELKLCIIDHKMLIELRHCIQMVITKGMFFQIVITGINLSYGIVYLVKYADNFFTRVYYFMLGLTLTLEIFPCCYYGSMCEMEFSDLPYAIFSSNWIDQDREFKKNTIIFAERCFQSMPFICMGLFRIHLNSFVVTIKSAYSLFTLTLDSK